MHDADSTAAAGGRASAAGSLEEGFLVAQLDEIEPVRCPCGEARRAFAVPGNDVATLHVTEISTDARTHYHERMTEIYYVLDGEGHLELRRPPGALRRVPLRPGTSVLIRPGTRHRAVGRLRCIIVPVPAFDAADEHFDD